MCQGTVHCYLAAGGGYLSDVVKFWHSVAVCLIVLGQLFCWCCWRVYLRAIVYSKNGKCIVCFGGSGLGYLGLKPFFYLCPAFICCFFLLFYVVAFILASIGCTNVVGLEVTVLVVLGAGASMSVRTKSTLASSCRIALSGSLSCL